MFYVTSNGEKVALYNTFREMYEDLPMILYLNEKPIEFFRDNGGKVDRINMDMMHSIVEKR